MNFAREQPGYAVINESYVYVFGGCDSCVSTEFWSLGVEFDWWTPGPDMPTFAMDFAFGYIDDWIYIFGAGMNWNWPHSGFSSSYALEYCVTGGQPLAQWVVSDFPVSTFADFLPYQYAASVTYNNKIYGYGSTPYANTFVMIDPLSNSAANYSFPPDLPLAGVAMVVYKDLIWFLGGFDSYNNYDLTDTVFAFDPVAIEWHKAPSLPYSTAGASAVVLRDQIVLIGGKNAATGVPYLTMSSAFQYTPGLEYKIKL